MKPILPNVRQMSVSPAPIPACSGRFEAARTEILSVRAETLLGVEPTPDERWQLFAAGLGASGQPTAMTFGYLRSRADEWAALAPKVEDPFGGPGALLRMARSLFAHSWFDYEFMAVGCTVAFQALEAALRPVYHGEEKVPARALLKRIESAGILPPNIAAVADSGFELRNRLSHPVEQSAFTPPMAISMIETSHRLVGLLVAEAMNVDADGSPTSRGQVARDALDR